MEKGKRIRAMWRKAASGLSLRGWLATDAGKLWADDFRAAKKAARPKPTSKPRIVRSAAAAATKKNKGTGKD